MYNRFKQIARKLIGSFQATTGSITWKDILYGYRLFLDRNPESPQAIRDKLKRLRTTQQLRGEFVNSEEFKQKNQGLYSLRLSGNEPPMFIEEVSDLDAIFAHVQNVWEHLGEVEPHWSVITSEEYKSSRMQDPRDFYNSGRSDAETLFKTLERNGIDYSAFKTCLEYGCGLGRITGWLAKSFDHVIGYDISRSHLRIAREYFEEAGVKNIAFNHVSSPHAIENFPKVDVVFSLIVLQHNPPPIIRVTIRELIKALNPGGIAYFQVPTYRLGYRFSLQEYLSGQAAKDEMEMHVLPQHEVFNIVGKEHGKVLEVFEDGCIGFRHGERSNIFLIQKM